MELLFSCSNADCSWTITTEDPDYVVNVNVIASDIEYSPSCSYDYYELFDGKWVEYDLNVTLSF